MKIFLLFRLLYKHFIQNIINALTNDAQVTILALQCFKEISYCVCTLLSFELQTFLNSICMYLHNNLLYDNLIYTFYTIFCIILFIFYSWNTI